MRRVGILIIHGIGASHAGGVLSSARLALAGLALSVAERLPPELIQELQDTTADRPVEFRGLQLTADDVTVDLVELYWASVIGRTSMRNPIRSATLGLTTIEMIPTIGTRSARDTRIVSLAGTFGMIQRWLLFGIILSGALTVLLAEPAARLWHARFGWFEPVTAVTDDFTGVRRTLSPQLEARPFFLPPGLDDSNQPRGSRFWRGAYSRLIMQRELPPPLFLGIEQLLPKVHVVLLGAWQAVIVVVWLVTIVLTPLVLLGNRSRASHLAMVWRNVAITSLLAFVATFGAVAFFCALSETAAALSQGVESGEWEVTRCLLCLLAIGLGVVLFKASLLAVNLLRDISAYLCDDESEALSIQDKIRSTIEGAIESLAGGASYHQVVVVAHSMGSVMLIDALEALHKKASHRVAAPVDIITAGSPVARMIAVLLPGRVESVHAIAARLRSGSRPVLGRWWNAYRIFDYVGQSLTYNALPLDLVRRSWPVSDPETGVADLLLRPRYRLPLGHSDYWSDGRFRDFVGKVIHFGVSPTKADAL